MVNNNGMEFSVRRAKPQDYESLIRLLGKFVGNEDRYKNKDNDSVSKVLKNRNCYIDVAVVKGRIIGFITYSIRSVIRYPAPILEVEEFFVLEEFRRLKIGKRLIERAIEYSKKKGCYYIFLASSKERVEAHGFYKNMNFDEYAFHYRRKL